jgi:ribosomal protein L37AE/L43A
MSNKINEKLGLGAAGARAMMKLPKDRALRNRLTSATCPSCGRRGASLSRRVADAFWCTYCNHTWQPEASA